MCKTFINQQSLPRALLADTKYLRETSITSTRHNRLPRHFPRQELSEEVIVIGFQLFQVWLGVSFRIQVVRIELFHPFLHRLVLLIFQVLISPMPMPCIERVKTSM